MRFNASIPRHVTSHSMPSDIRPVFAALPPSLSLFHYSASLSCTHRRPISFALAPTGYCAFTSDAA
ncbi:uncharacterized protein N7525_006449 [Penicillium rubens]|uniref:uncharacterized protein n=1 Tax=Penicillium rubens TaxID=1108849 RepID=UPI002A5A1326|nr:uncharacterized protein N7525_006449 [Penicillium rubens]KAJ5828196.1 hypothetical protein N7525_006449 [Penicillium rubens]